MSLPSAITAFQQFDRLPGHRSHVGKKPTQLENIKAHLDLLILALEALTGLGSEAILEAAAHLNLTGFSDRVSVWRLRQASPLRKGQGGRKKLDVEEAQGLVLITCHLAQEHQATLRQAVSLLEQASREQTPPHRWPLLGDYLDRFCHLYGDRMREDGDEPVPVLSHLAIKLLVDLLFYSGEGGAKRLWLALLDNSLT